MMHIVLRKIYNRLWHKRRKTKAQLFCDECKRLEVTVPASLDLSLSEVLIPHHLTVRQFARHLEGAGAVLDMGCGLGILSVIAKKKGAQRIVAADINEAAIRETRKFIPCAHTVKSDLFENIEGKFDAILFNAPWVEGEVTKPLEHAWCDHNDVAGRFFSQVADFLAENGSIWFQYSDAFIDKYKRLHALIEENGLYIERSWHHTRWGVSVGHMIKVYLYKIKHNG